MPTSLSRSGNTSPFGKNDRSIDVQISERLEEAVIAMAMLNGMKKGEYVRHLLECAMFGEFSMAQMMVADRRNLNPWNTG